MNINFFYVWDFFVSNKDPFYSWPQYFWIGLALLLHKDLVLLGMWYKDSFLGSLVENLKLAYTWYCRASLSEAYDGDTTFADALEFFGGQEDPLSLSIGGRSCFLIYLRFYSHQYENWMLDT